MKIRLAIGGLALAGVLAADCVDGSRDTSAEEQAYQAEVLAALRASLPPAPAGWKLEDRGLFAPAKSVCKGSDASRAVYSASYVWMDGVAEQNKRSEEMSRKVGALRTIPTDKLNEMNEYARQGRALQREIPKARAAGDMAGVDRLNAEIKELTAKAYAIRKAHQDAVAPQIEAISNEFIKAEEGKSYNVKVSMAANDYMEAGLKPVAGLVRSGSQSSILFGQAPPKGKRALQVYSITARFTGDAFQVETLVKGWQPSAAIALMQGKPAPAVAGQ